VTATKPAAKKTAARSDLPRPREKVDHAKKVTTAKSRLQRKSRQPAKENNRREKATLREKSSQNEKKKRQTEPVVPDVSSGVGETL
jgi:hypothetical protein